ncbi:MAG: Rieske 2Fe-2S domain-containing protein [Anaerolineae bacterium]|nr:Rieske 2Fe-2S domain-containing protein [Anaerolineae bacterium]
MTAEYVVASVDDVPEGQHIVVEVRGREIGVFNVRGQYYALPNVCFHQNGPLCRGAVSGTVIVNAETGWKRAWMHDGEIVVCPWHALEFNVTTGQCLAYPKRRVPTYEVKVEDHQIKVVL